MPLVGAGGQGFPESGDENKDVSDSDVAMDFLGRLDEEADGTIRKGILFSLQTGLLKQENLKLSEMFEWTDGQGVKPKLDFKTNKSSFATRKKSMRSR